MSAHKLINTQNVRAFILSKASELRPAQGFTRVSDVFLVRAESTLRIWLENEICRLPSKGKTVK